MEFHTLQEFMLSTKGWVYIIMGFALVGWVCWWSFLTARDDD